MKGKTNNPNGRPKGAVNKRTKESIERVEWVLSLIEPKLEADIKALSERDRVMLWNDLQEYVRPKLARTTIVGDKDEPVTLKVLPFGHKDK